MSSLINAIGMMLVMGAVLGLALGIAGMFFQVEVDMRTEEVTAMLPGYNCGGCGYAGCAGMAEGLVNGDVKNVSICKPSKADAREKIAAYLKETPGPDGSVIIVKANA